MASLVSNNVFPCSLAQNKNQFLSFSIRNSEQNALPATALPIFRSPEHASKFRDEVIKITDTSSYLWSVSMCKKTKEATFTTRVRNFENNQEIHPKNICFDEDQFTDQLIFQEIGCLIVEDYTYNRMSNILTVNGLLWLPFVNEGFDDPSGYINLSSSIFDDDDIYLDN